MSFVWNSLNLIFEKKLNILRDSFKKRVEAFLTKISSFENESGIDSGSQVDIRINRKNKIRQSVLEPIKSHKQIFSIFESWIAKLISKKFRE